MRVLTCCTRSLRDDYNSIMDTLTGSIGRYFDVVNVDEVGVDNVQLSEMDCFFVFADDSSDILDTYNTLLRYVTDTDKRARLVLYTRNRESYTSSEYYYAKWLAQNKRLIRVVDFTSLYDIIFDIMVYSSLMFDADINVSSGQLLLMDSPVLDLYKVDCLLTNEIIARQANTIAKVRREREAKVRAVSVDNLHLLIDVDKINNYIHSLSIDYDKYLEYAIDLYREIVRSFANTNIGVLDYIFAKEYFRIGHWTSIMSCFNRGSFKEKLADIDVDNAISILKMEVYSQAFHENFNEFTLRIVDETFKVGKRLERKAGRDIFFHFFEHELLEHSGKGDGDFAHTLSYIRLIERKALIADNSNAYIAYYLLANHSLECGMIDVGLSYALKCEKYADTPKRRIDIWYLIAYLYRLECNDVKVREYILKILDSNDMLATGYYNSYARVVMHIVKMFGSDIGMTDKVYDSIIQSAIVSSNIKIFFEIDRLKRMVDEPLSKRLVQLNMLKERILNKAVDEPSVLLSLLFKANNLMAELYTAIGDETNAMLAYREAYEELAMLENIDEEIDEEMAYIEYKIGDTAVGMASSESFRRLVKAEKRTKQYILSSKKYVSFYVNILMTINKRFFEDKRIKVGIMVSKNNLASLVEVANIREEYSADVALYCLAMAKLLENLGEDEIKTRYIKFSEHYIDSALNNGTDIDYDKVDSLAIM